MTEESTAIGRGAQTNPPNRFERVACDWMFDEASPARKIRTQFLADEAKSIISRNGSPDLEFNYSLNPYRGCEHGCSYCYARPYHEFVGLSAGIDFETKILVKHRAADLFRDWLNDRQRTGEPVNLSGATDCYQLAEREYELTRRCLEVALDYRQPITIVTKNALVLRDVDILQSMASDNLVRVNISITSLDQQLVRSMEPRTSSPVARLRAIRELSECGVPVRALLAPIVPGLNDIEIPNLIEAVHEAGATSAGTSMLRLPGAVQGIFFDWLRRNIPEKESVVRSRLAQIRGGELNDERFGLRMSGQGVMAEQIRKTFELFARRHGLSPDPAPLNSSLFRRPGASRQQRLF